MLLEGINHPDNRFHQITGRIRRRGTDKYWVFEKLRLEGVWHVYGGFQDQSETITCAVADTWYHVTNATNDLWTGTESDGFSISSDVMTILNAGDYFGTLAISLSGLAGKDFEFRIYNVTDAAAEGYHIGVTTTGASNYQELVMPLYIEADAGDQFRMEVRCTSVGSGDPTLVHAIFYISYLHD